MYYKDYFPIVEYYRRYVIPLNEKRYKVKNDKMMVCPLHNDHDPSLGVIDNGKDEVFHCFGCGSHGNVVQLHKKVVLKLSGRYVSDREALADLARIFGYKLSNLPDFRGDSTTEDDLKSEVSLEKAKDRFDISDYRGMLLEGKRKKKGIAYFNTLMMIMTNEVKGNGKKV